jgi:subtilase family serine protease
MLRRSVFRCVTAKDLGLVSDDLQLEHMYLLLNRLPEQQQQIDDLIEQLHDQNSPQYHRWLTAGEVAERFGTAEEDIKTVTDWLGARGFVVHGVYRANGVIDFSGSAAQVSVGMIFKLANQPTKTKSCADDFHEVRDAVRRP